MSKSNGSGARIVFFFVLKDVLCRAVEELKGNVSFLEQKLVNLYNYFRNFLILLVAFLFS